MTEFIGSRISLISKRDIRYVGTLHEINSENSTVALERVVSYGTEGRRPDDEVPPSLDNVYEYIVFRGSDVKDLRIEEGPKEGAPKPKVPDDPAILGTQSMSKPQQTQGQAQNHQASSSHGASNPQSGPPGQPPQHQPGPPAGFPPYGFNPNQRFGGPQAFPPGSGPFPMHPGPYGAPPGWYPPHGFPPHMPPGGFPPQPLPMGAPGQPGRGPVPPQPGPGIPTPTGSTGPIEGQQQFPKPGDNGAAKAPGSNTPIPLLEAPSGSSPGMKPETKNDTAPQGKAPPTGPKGNRIVPAVPLSKGSAPANGAAGVGKPGEDANRDARAAVAAAMAKLPAAQGQKPAGDDGMDNLSKKVSEMRTSENARTSRQPGTGGYAAGNRGGRGGGHRGGRNQGPKVEIPTTDYDFASANAKFNKQDLVKEAIASGSPIGTPDDETSFVGGEHSNGAAAAAGRKGSTDSGAAAPASYNKTTSFFDDISSEIKDRVENQESGQRLGGREFRNEERQKNMETFGQGSVDNGYRHRGGRGGRGRGGRGGFHRGRGGGRGGARGRGGAAFAADA